MVHHAYLRSISNLESETDDVVLQGIEFWRKITILEMYLEKYHFAKKELKYLIPKLISKVIEIFFLSIFNVIYYLRIYLIVC